jgi:hypothetical protein
MKPMQIQTVGSVGYDTTFKYNTQEIKELIKYKSRYLSLFEANDANFFENKYSFSFAPRKISNLVLEFSIPPKQLDEKIIKYRIEVRAHIHQSGATTEVKVMPPVISPTHAKETVQLTNADNLSCDRLTVYFCFENIDNEIEAKIRLLENE